MGSVGRVQGGVLLLPGRGGAAGQHGGACPGPAVHRGPPWTGPPGRRPGRGDACRRGPGAESPLPPSLTSHGLDAL